MNVADLCCLHDLVAVTTLHRHTHTQDFVPQIHLCLALGLFNLYEHKVVFFSIQFELDLSYLQ